MEPRERSNRQTHVSHTAIGGYSAGDTGNIHPSVGIKPLSHARSYDTTNTSAYVGLDALFTPVTIVNSGKPEDFIGHPFPLMFPTGYNYDVVEQEISFRDIDSDKLNPYSYYHVHPEYANISDTHIPTISGTQSINTIALRLPMLAAGWGYDINNRVAPSSTRTDAEAYYSPLAPGAIARHPEDWKVGPIDFRWDNIRGVWTGAQPINVLKTVALRHNHDFLVLSPVSMTGMIIDRDDILGLEYCQVCSGEVVYMSQLTAPAHQYYALTKPMKGVRVITGIEIQADVVYLQYSYIVTPYVSAGHKIVNRNGQISLEPTPNICDDLNSQPSIIGIPRVPAIEQ